MNIAFFSDSYRPYFSGVVKSIDSFKEELEKKGHLVYIFAPDYPSVDKQDDVYRFTSLPTPLKKDFRLAIPISNKITSIMKGLKIDIIHTHTPFLMGGLARYAAHKLNIPLVFTYHTLYEEYVHYVPLIGNLARGVTIRYVKDFCRSCDLIIAPSGYVEKRIKNYQIDSPVLTISTGLNIDSYRNKKEKLLEEINNDFHLNKFALKLIFVGRLGEEKNVSFLLRVFNLLVCKHRLKACLIIIGSGPDRDKLEKYCQEKGLSAQVIFTGKESPERVTAFYQLSDIFVFPSRTETQGLVTIEAMASGLPVVAVNAAGTKYMVDNMLNGILVDEEEEEFVEAIFNLSTDSFLYKTMRENAIKKSNSFSIEKMTTALITGYQSLFENKQVKTS